MTYWRTQHFRAMQEAWYARLRVEGFEDVEQLVQGEMMLRQTADHPYRGQDELCISTKETYYRVLSQKLEQDGTWFRNEIDRLILSCFAMGTKVTRIVEILQREGKPRCRNTIMFTIRKYEMQWGLRAYTRKQLNKRERKTA